LFTFGSYYLNVDYSDGDIDMVCVVPRLINKEEHFFKDLYELLKANSKTSFI
jgi:poly(A) polymerase Pap1